MQSKVCFFISCVLLFTWATPTLGVYDFIVQNYRKINFLPGAADTTIQLTIRNAGTQNWDTSTYLQVYDYVDENTLIVEYPLSATTPGSNLQVDMDLNITSSELRLHRYSLGLRRGSVYAVRRTMFLVEVTCSDGLFCNGAEQWMNGACVNAADPCDDGIPCTIDGCVESEGRCTHTLTTGCEACTGVPCTANCTDKACGNDGCGGKCGDCDPGEACNEGVCVVASGGGTCASPIPLFGGQPFQLGRVEVNGDTTNYFHVLTPSCNYLSEAREVVYSFTIPAGGKVGIDARSYGYDTVMEIRKICTDPDSVVACSDDATPPGDFGSRIAALLDPGDYILYVDGFSVVDMGPFTLTVNFVANCVPKCDGAFCGDDLCGGECGICDDGYACNQFARCIPDPCIGNCTNRTCGDDGCGVSCGDCGVGGLCSLLIGQCYYLPVCDHLAPTCGGGCDTDEYCGSDCECHTMDDSVPDLVIHNELGNDAVFEEVYINDASCALYEQCVGGTGLRRLLRFTVSAINQGSGDFVEPDPKDRPDLFQYSPCHNHYHFMGFAKYELLDLSGTIVLTGHKEGYCLEDTVRFLDSPAYPCDGQYDCGNQGVSVGWADSYGRSLDCQWLDVTGIPEGTYTLVVRLNMDRRFHELSFENNEYSVPITIPPLTAVNGTSTNTSTRPIEESSPTDVLYSAASALERSAWVVVLALVFLALKF